MTGKAKTEVRREQLVRAALDLISERGIEGLSAAALGGRVGLAPSAMYRHFSGIDEVLDGTIDLIGRLLLENVRLSRTSSADAIGCLEHLLERHLELIQRNRGVPRLIFSPETQGSADGRRAKVYSIVARYLKAVAAVVREGQEAGSIRRDIDPGTAALLFLGLIQPAALLWHLSDGKYDIPGKTRKAWRVFERSLRSPDRVRAAPGKRAQPGRRRERGGTR